MQANLFGWVVQEKRRRPRPHRVSGGWELIDHACRHCMGRLAKRVNPDGSVVHRCCECGASVEGEHSKLCWCGAEVRGHGSVFECVRNNGLAKTTRQEVLVRERPMVKVPERQVGRVSNPVRVGGVF
jgi:hypothetical protein